VQGLVNFSTAIADGIAVILPAFCYIAACCCFTFAVWTLWTFAEPHRRHHHHWVRPWVPFISLVLCGVFASFPKFLTMANVSVGTSMAVQIGSYTATTPGSAASLLGATPTATVINVVALFQYFFEAFGAACVFLAILRWRSIINGRGEGSPTACGVQLTFGVLCINILTVAKGVVTLFTTGG